MKHYTKNNPLLKIYGKVTALLLITLALIVISFLAAITDQQAMKRESNRPTPVQGEIVLSLDQALNLSLAYGDYRRVNVDWNGVA